MKKLTARERDFCSHFLNTGKVCESALNAGYVKNPQKSGFDLLCRNEIAQQIELLAKNREKSLANMSSAGYQKLAFGDITDAVSLLYMENPQKAELDKMDLFLVSEIKRPKDGSMEIKFFDRLKALEKLDDRNESGDGAARLFDAINRSAESAGSDKAED